MMGFEAEAVPLSVAHVITSVVESAGPTYSVRRLAEALAARGHGSDVLAVGAAASGGATRPLAGGARERILPPDRALAPPLAVLHTSTALARACDEAARRGAVLHANGLWRLPNVYPGRATRRHGGALVLSPRGMLEPTALCGSRLAKAIFWPVQRCTVERATCIHATSPEEAAAVRAFGITTPVAVIPNGIDIPAEPEERRAAAGLRTVLYLGRVHRQKGIDRLLEAWRRVEPRHPQWRLRIVGPSQEGHGAELEALARRLGLARVVFEGPVHGEAKRAAYREADLFVLPTLFESFGMVVAEALANATPVIVTQGAPWRTLEANGGGWWIPHGPEPLAAALDAALDMPRDALAAMGRRGREWMARDFSWERVAADMERVYRWCHGGRGEVDDLLAA